MSALAKRLSLLPTSTVAMVDRPIPTLEVKTAAAELLYESCKEYQIACTFTVKGFLSKGDDMAEFAKLMKRQVIQEVFGEFRPLIIEMFTATYDKDTTRVRKLLAELENKMFVEGL